MAEYPKKLAVRELIITSRACENQKDFLHIMIKL